MKKIILYLSFTIVIFAQNIVGINVNNDELELEGTVSLNKYVGMNSSSGLIANISYLNGVDKDLFNLGLGLYQAYPEIDGLLFGFGLNTVAEEDLVAIPFYVHALYVLPFIKYVPKTSLSAKVSYAPEIMSFSDGKNFMEVRTEIDFDIVNNVSVYGGYRNITSYYKFDEEMDISDSFYGGFKYSF